MRKATKTKIAFSVFLCLSGIELGCGSVKLLWRDDVPEFTLENGGRGWVERKSDYLTGIMGVEEAKGGKRKTDGFFSSKKRPVVLESVARPPSRKAVQLWLKARDIIEETKAPIPGEAELA